MEAGDTETVITSLRHPYTRPLMDSIPWPDINRRWGIAEVKATEEERADHGPGCKFYSRLDEESPRIVSERLSELLPM